MVLLSMKHRSEPSWLTDSWILTRWDSPPFYGLLHSCILGLHSPDSLEKLDANAEVKNTIYPHKENTYALGGCFGITYCPTCQEEAPEAIVFLLRMIEINRELA
jgi:hypothetical protein